MNIEISEADILKMEIAELYDTLKMMQESEDLEEYEEEIREIEEGIDIKIPIIYLTNEWYEPYPSTKRVKVMGFRKYEINEFFKEKSAREAKMRVIILENLGNEHPAEAR